MKFPCNEKRLFVTMEEMQSLSCLDRKDVIGRLNIYSIKDEDLLLNLYPRCISYLDCFVVLVPAVYEQQSIFWKEFYSNFGENYDTLIDSSINKQCIDILLNTIEKRLYIDTESIILDFGCGNGTSLEMNKPYSIYGYDPVEIMRKQASAKGMLTFSKESLSSIPDRCFDAIFSSFVFHMGITEKDIVPFLSKMKKKSLWVANFYKGINIEKVNTIFEQLGFQVNEIDNVPRVVGSVFAYERVRY